MVAVIRDCFALADYSARGLVFGGDDVRERRGGGSRVAQKPAQRAILEPSTSEYAPATHMRTKSPGSKGLQG